jgi:uncharacterized protein
VKPSLGEFSGGRQVTVDVARLLETRMLIQAGSGYGKSYVCRRLLEQTAGHVQQLVIDPEGEFATLREKYDYVIAAAHDGDAIAHPRTAQLLARRLLETRVSAVLDIYDLKAHERHTFVKLFCQALVDAPKSLWQPVLVLLDESHVYCPEQGESEAQGAVTDLATRGRKRGFGLVMATQRLSKLSKDAAAESFNKLIGRCQLDVDVKRAALELGMTPKDATEAFRTFEPGDFFVFGPALSPTVERMHGGKVVTTHPKSGQRGLTAPPAPTAAIKAMLPKLADLPKEAEQQARTLEDMRRELAGVKRELAQARKSRGNETAAADANSLKAAEARGRQLGAHQERKSIVTALTRWQRPLKGQIHQALEAALREVTLPPELGRDPGSGPVHFTTHPPLKEMKPATRAAVVQVVKVAADKLRSNGAGEPLPKGERAILTALIQFPDGLRREQITVLTTFARSTRDRYLQYLQAKGLVESRGELVIATEAGIAAVPDAEPLPTGEALREHWMRQLPEGERKLLEVLIEAYPQAVSREDLSDRTGLARSTRDRYLQYMSNKMIVNANRGEVRASETLF